MAIPQMTSNPIKQFPNSLINGIQPVFFWSYWIVWIVWAVLVWDVWAVLALVIVWIVWIVGIVWVVWVVWVVWEPWVVWMVKFENLWVVWEPWVVSESESHWVVLVVSVQNLASYLRIWNWTAVNKEIFIAINFFKTFLYFSSLKTRVAKPSKNPTARSDTWL